VRVLFLILVTLLRTIPVVTAKIRDLLGWFRVRVE
jgi:hypothetical protein